MKRSEIEKRVERLKKQLADAETEVANYQPPTNEDIMAKLEELEGLVKQRPIAVPYVPFSPFTPRPYAPPFAWPWHPTYITWSSNGTLGRNW